MLYAFRFETTNNDTKCISALFSQFMVNHIHMRAARIPLICCQVYKNLNFFVVTLNWPIKSELEWWTHESHHSSARKPWIFAPDWDNTKQFCFFSDMQIAHGMCISLWFITKVVWIFDEDYFVNASGNLLSSSHFKCNKVIAISNHR